MGILSRLFASPKAAPPSSGFAPVSSQFGAALDSKIPGANSSDLTRREIIRVALHDMCRAYGIPSNWIECQALSLRGNNADSRIYVRLLVVHWDEQLLKYALAFQRHLRAEVSRLDPRAMDWLMGIGWELVSEANCPYLTMPKPAAWIAATTMRSAAPVDVLDRRSRPRDGDASQRKPVASRPGSPMPVPPVPARGAPGARSRPPIDEDFPETRQADL